MPRPSIAGAAFAAVVLAACGGGGGTVIVPQEALDSLQEYAFISEIEVQSDEGDLRATYDAVAEGLLSVQGSFSGEGELLDSLDLPARADLIATDSSGYWLREPGNEWQLVRLDGGERYFSLQMLNGLATPPIFLSYFVFGELELQADGSEEIRGLDTARVRLDRDEIISLVPSVTALNVPGEGPQDLPAEEVDDFRNDADEGLPDDFAVETWIVKDEGYPARIVVEFTVPDADEGLLVGQFPGGAHIRLQMDITDPKADVDIQPPHA